MIRLRTVRNACVRRLTALLVAVCIVAGPVEAAIPDVHDGDAPAASHGGQPVQTAAEATSPAPLSDTRGSQNGTPASEHTTHVDHCAHGHAAGIADARSTSAPVDWHMAGAIGELAQLHESVVLSPRQRPPII